METLAEIDSCITRLSKMGAQDAFFHPDFVRLLSLLKFPYLYDGNGTEVPKEAMDRILLLVAEKAEGMPKDLVGEDYSRHANTCSYVLNALSAVQANAGNADYFVRIFLSVAEGGTPPEPVKTLRGFADMKDRVEHVAIDIRFDDGGLFDACADRDAVFQKMIDSRSPELCESIAARISSLQELRESAVYLFSVALDHSSSGVELEIDTIMKLAKFAGRWKDAEMHSAHYKRTLEEGKGHFSGKTAEFERLAAALLRQIKAAERQRIARVYDLQELRLKWKGNQAREAAMARDYSPFTRRLKICSGRC